MRHLGRAGRVAAGCADVLRRRLLRGNLGVRLHITFSVRLWFRVVVWFIFRDTNNTAMTLTRVEQLHDRDQRLILVSSKPGKLIKTQTSGILKVSKTCASSQNVCPVDVQHNFLCGIRKAADRETRALPGLGSAAGCAAWSSRRRRRCGIRYESRRKSPPPPPAARRPTPRRSPRYALL